MRGFVALFGLEIAGNKAAHARTDYGDCAHGFPLIIVGGRLLRNEGRRQISWAEF
jgi:hypothetical protein